MVVHTVLTVMINFYRKAQRLSHPTYVESPLNLSAKNLARLIMLWISVPVPYLMKITSGGMREIYDDVVTVKNLHMQNSSKDVFWCKDDFW